MVPAPSATFVTFTCGSRATCSVSSALRDVRQSTGSVE